MTAIGNASKVSYTYLDRSGETTKSQLHFDPIDDVGDNSAVLDQATGSVALVGTALGLLTLLPQAGTSVSLPIGVFSPALPSNPSANREVAIRFIYKDNVNAKKYRFDLPAPVDAIMPLGTDDVDMADTLIVAFKAVFDANVKSEWGNACTLLTGRFVGRRS